MTHRFRDDSIEWQEERGEGEQLTAWKDRTQTRSNAGTLLTSSLPPLLLQTDIYVYSESFPSVKIFFLDIFSFSHT